MSQYVRAMVIQDRLDESYSGYVIIGRAIKTDEHTPYTKIEDDSGVHFFNSYYWRRLHRLIKRMQREDSGIGQLNGMIVYYC